MKEEALRLADQLDEDSKYGECDWTYPKVSADMIRKLVAHIEELENPIMQAIAQAFEEPRELSDEEILEELLIPKSDWEGYKAQVCLKQIRAILKKASEK
jgi:hypothetical protein